MSDRKSRPASAVVVLLWVAVAVANVWLTFTMVSDVPYVRWLWFALGFVAPGLLQFTDRNGRLGPRGRAWATLILGLVLLVLLLALRSLS